MEKANFTLVRPWISKLAGVSAMVLAAFLALPVTAAETRRDPGCSHPLFLQYQARISDRSTVKGRLEGWREFLHTYPDNPCADRVREIVREDLVVGGRS